MDTVPICMLKLWRIRRRRSVAILSLLFAGLKMVYFLLYACQSLLQLRNVAGAQPRLFAIGFGDIVAINPDFGAIATGWLGSVAFDLSLPAEQASTSKENQLQVPYQLRAVTCPVTDSTARVYASHRQSRDLWQNMNEEGLTLPCRSCPRLQTGRRCSFQTVVE